MFNAKSQTLIQAAETPAALKLYLFDDLSSLSFSEVLQHWQTDETFRAFFISQLSAAPYRAYFFELPALSRKTLAKPFECVLVNNTQLLKAPVDHECFAEYFRDDELVVDFNNLGGDACLIAPCPPCNPQSDVNHYSHLAAFSRLATMSQQHALWQRVGKLVTDKISDQPLWLSTSGLGVAWLHLRLDKTPKYYSYPPYRDL